MDRVSAICVLPKEHPACLTSRFGVLASQAHSAKGALHRGGWTTREVYDTMSMLLNHRVKQKNRVVRQMYELAVRRSYLPGLFGVHDVQDISPYDEELSPRREQQEPERLREW